MQKKGKVFLVGSGPGDPGLLTVKAAGLLHTADVVVYDRLVSPAILDLIPGGISKISVGKATGRHSLPQEEINELLANLAANGRSVVRLKGGDPFIFGRGSEEALFLRKRGIEFEVVPGITAATACSAYSGVPLTHRGLSRGVRLVTGHFQDDEPIDLDWRALADPDSTLVIYMGLANLDRICTALIEEGLDPSTPAAAVQDGTTAHQKSVISELVSLPIDASRAGLEPPVLIVIGKTVSLAEQLAWFEPQEAEMSNVEKDHIASA